MPVVLETHELTKVYPRVSRDSQPMRAVDGVSLSVAPGEVFGILGPNGAGKTTTIRLCTGTTKPSSGHVRVAGFDPSSHPVQVKERIGVVSDFASLYSELSVLDNLHLWPTCMAFPEARAKNASRPSSLGLG
jgi:ABC-2 type transport system ATP-binding protein